MRFMIMVKATEYSEAGMQESRAYRDAKLAFRQELTEAGVLLAADKLQPSARGMRISYPTIGREAELQAGPFDAGQELVGEYVMFEAEGEAEALRWALRMPVPAGQGEFKLELRRLEDGWDNGRSVGELALESDLQEQLSMLRRA